MSRPTSGKVSPIL